MDFSYLILGMSSIGYKAFNGVTFVSGSYALKFVQEPSKMNGEGIFVLKENLKNNSLYYIGYVDNEDIEITKTCFYPENFLKGITIFLGIYMNLKIANEEEIKLSEVFNQFMNNKDVIELIASRNNNNQK